MKAQIVSFHCVLKNKLGQVLSSSFNQDVINQLEEENSNSGDLRLKGLIEGLQNVHQGEHRRFSVPANEGYGPYRPDLVLEVSRSELSRGESLVIGSEIEGKSGPNGTQQVFRVVQIKGDTVVLDGNHPLAGQDLVFEIEVLSARDACLEDFEDSAATAPRYYFH